ncbi:AAA family ATPase [Vreelandella populi]|uniref:AAA family ATPase n=1 Tax=Vreelandella populi TaxID=2498858 RepID=UPI000F8D4409|nr:AAA family ATPase [Halomonas populi]RUR52737.1 ATP-binding protein [Halomonas populi]
MSYAVMVLGESGAGKSRSMKNLNPDDTLVIQPIRKPLPFRSAGWGAFSKDNPDGSVIVTDNIPNIIKCVVNAEKWGKKHVVIDDAQYIMVNESLRRSAETGFTKFTEMAKGYVDLVHAAANTNNDVRVYFMTHIQTDDFGFSRAKTVGKMIDSQVCLEGLFSIVLKCQARDGKHFFSTRTNGNDPVKTPEEMFDSGEIENDLAAVDAAICDYYGITQQQEQPA